MNMRRTIAASAIALMATQTAALADPIKIAINEWTGQHLSAHIAGNLIEKLGHDVEYVTAGAVPQFAAIADGSLHFQPEAWDNNVGDIFPDAVANGDIVIVGDLGLSPLEGWLYPPYMEDACPGLPSFEALYDCAQSFATSETFPNGRLITYPADWGTRSIDVIEKLDLPLKPIAGGSEGAMIAEFNAAVAAEQPIIMMFWQPHWIHAEVDANWVEWNPSDGPCDEANQTRENACGFTLAGVKKIVSRDFGETWPDAMKLIEAMSIDNETQNNLILEVDQNGVSVEEAAAKWVAENEDIWGPWVAAAM